MPNVRECVDGDYVIVFKVFCRRQNRVTVRYLHTHTHTLLEVLQIFSSFSHHQSLSEEPGQGWYIENKT